MTAASDKLGELLAKTNNFEESLDALFEVVSELGFTQVLYARQRMKPRIGEDRWVPLRLNVRNFPKNWEGTWRQFEEHDPYYHACFNGTLPFDWRNVQNSDTLNPIEKKAWKYLADFGLTRGMTIPLHLPDNKFAVVSAIVDRPNANWTEIYENNYETMFTLTHVFNDWLEERKFVDQVETAKCTILSPREQECLCWAARGKTSPEIAMILDRSVDTVRLHIKNAMLKLDASTRTHAVAKAVQFGVLEADQLSA